MRTELLLCWKCGRKVSPRKRTASQYVMGLGEASWPETNPPPGSYLCDRCRWPVIDHVARQGGQLYHLIRSPRDFVLILQILGTMKKKPLDEIVQNGINLEPGSFYRSGFAELVKKLGDRTADEKDLKQWGKDHGGWGCGTGANAGIIAGKAWNLITWTPAWLATATRWDTGYRDTRITQPVVTETGNNDRCILRVTAHWEIHGSSERGLLVVLPESEKSYLWFLGVEQFTRSGL